MRFVSWAWEGGNKAGCPAKLGVCPAFSAKAGWRRSSPASGLVSFSSRLRLGNISLEQVIISRKGQGQGTGCRFVEGCLQHAVALEDLDERLVPGVEPQRLGPQFVCQEILLEAPGLGGRPPPPPGVATAQARGGRQKGGGGPVAVVRKAPSKGSSRKSFLPGKRSSPASAANSTQA